MTQREIMNPKKLSLEQLLESNEALLETFNVSFIGLSVVQINWKPSPDSWSIAQCTEHLLKTNDLYIGRLEEVLDNAYEPKFLEKIPVLKSLTAGILLWGITTTKKLKAPAIFLPSSSEVNPSVISDFIRQHSKMKLLMQRAISLKAEAKTITSPASPVMVFRLIDIFRISAIHSQRHIQQALRVKNNPNFPS